MLGGRCAARCRVFFLVPLLLVNAPWLTAQEKTDQPDGGKSANREMTVEQIVELAKPSVVVVTFKGRNGERQGLGTGFIADADGLIATNRHVLGDGRPITVQLPDGRSFDVTSVHASNRFLDLALIRIDAKNLPALELGDSDTLKDGQSIVVIGNPQGLKHSVVSGIVSARRDVEGKPMIQIAMPIEMGNSGGPVLDRFGRVQGIVSMKSAVTDNLGFAVTVNALKPLLAKPNPIAMSRWLTIGTLDDREWSTRFGATWRQRAGQISVSGSGAGFGGRALCLSQQKPPKRPYEVTVTVRLDDESGAAGLAFCSDDEHRHYGFYPSAGRLRLSRFEGPDVYSWQVLREISSDHYHPGEWNTLKARIEKGRIRCYVNGELVIEADEDALPDGKVGLAKFRNTVAQFKRFACGAEIASDKVDERIVERVHDLVKNVGDGRQSDHSLVETLFGDGTASITVLRDRAEELENQANKLRRLADLVHAKSVQTELMKVLDGPDEKVDLIHAVMLIAKLDNAELEVDAYRKQFDRLADELSSIVDRKSPASKRVEALNKLLFEEHGFHGSRLDYYNESNSYLNEVLDDREGLPITLSIIYMELAQRISLKVVGVGLPGHFIVRHEPDDGEAQLIDPFERGQILSKADAARQVLGAAGRPITDEDLAPVTTTAIIVRMVHNLMSIAQHNQDKPAMLRYLDTLLTISPDSVQDRGMRAILRFQTGDRAGALEDADWLIERRPPGVDIHELLRFRQAVEKSKMQG